MLENLQHLILTVTRDCNLNCQYCFEQDKQLYAQEKMSLAVFKRFMEKLLIDRKKYRQTNPVEICFHGGEPTLGGIPLLQTFIDEAQQQLGADKVIWAMQTNGTLLNEEWQHFAKKNKVKISVSLDGYNYGQNRLRFKKNAFKNYFRRMLAVKPVGALALLTKNNLSNMVFHIWFMYFKFKIGVRVNPAEFVDGPAVNPQEISGQQLARKFYLPLLRWSALFPCLAEHLLRGFLQSFFLETIYTKMTQNNETDLACRLCSAKFCSAGNGIINLLPNGALWACQRSQGLEDYRMGSVFESAIDPFGLKHFNKLYALALPQARTIRELRCDVCFAADICNYGCKAFGLLKTQGRATIRKELVCEAAQIVREYFSRNIYDMLFVYARLSDFSIRAARSRVKIYLPQKLNYDAVRYELKNINDHNISIAQDKEDNVYIAFSRKNLSLGNRLILSAQNFIQKGKK
ncbi:putative anaerobic sulfatase maturase [Candidatus Termititenax aidoneus]|uniref:Anaerobic sulfatase maturase n=1 Tax=Termititenax aidoneus TaxID=2218524 RepID=A0A388TA39_TERA1|nr:putative anaerobic sulfatase maturase [Candidatus Termititenax aidoneus]